LSTIAITKSIIVVDDEHDLVDLFSNALSSYGYDVSAFTDPILALESIKGNPSKYSTNYGFYDEQDEWMRTWN
jgi:CheY-like chemotaxis protein